MPAIPPATITRWHTTGTKSQQVAAHLYTWATRQPPGTIVPAPDIIIRDLPTITSPISVTLSRAHARASARVGPLARVRRDNKTITQRDERRVRRPPDGLPSGGLGLGC
jgi:hypothetical protein